MVGGDDGWVGGGGGGGRGGWGVLGSLQDVLRFAVDTRIILQARIDWTTLFIIVLQFLS